jgi:hypothetical protein
VTGRGRPKLGEVTSVRFPPDLEAAAKRAAANEGKNTTEWIRGLVNDEIARREGRCPACGQEVPS